MAWVLARALWAAAGRLGPAGGQRRSASGVWAWGMNTSGQCGTGGLSVVEEPTEVEALRGLRVGSVALGAKHSCVVLEDDGGVLTWGNGACGKLGHGTNDDVKKPSRVEALAGKRIVAAALGDSHSLFADAQGKVWGCGENKEGQLGLGTPLEMLAKQQREAWVMNAALQGEETLPHQKHLTQPGHVAVSAARRLAPRGRSGLTRRVGDSTRAGSGRTSTPSSTSCSTTSRTPATRSGRWTQTPRASTTRWWCRSPRPSTSRGC